MLPCILIFIFQILEQLGFWVDNIHCYAQTGQDIKDGVANPPIIMMCTKADAPEDPVGPN